jgi:hypothetical protein
MFGYGISRIYKEEGQEGAATPFLAGSGLWVLTH